MNRSRATLAMILTALSLGPVSGAFADSKVYGDCVTTEHWDITRNVLPNYRADFISDIVLKSNNWAAFNIDMRFQVRSLDFSLGDFVSNILDNGRHLPVASAIESFQGELVEEAPYAKQTEPTFTFEQELNPMPARSEYVLEQVSRQTDEKGLGLRYSEPSISVGIYRVTSNDEALEFSFSSYSVNALRSDGAWTNALGGNVFSRIKCLRKN